MPLRFLPQLVRGGGSPDRRSLPRLIIPGAMKAGTTSLFAYLEGHPQLAPSHEKEVHYFDMNFHRAPVGTRDSFSDRRATPRPHRCCRSNRALTSGFAVYAAKWTAFSRMRMSFCGPSVSSGSDKTYLRTLRRFSSARKSANDGTRFVAYHA